MATRNPIPSEAPEDLRFNAGKIDEEVNSDAEYYVDRFDEHRLTNEGRNKLAERQRNTWDSRFQDIAAQYGWRQIPYAAGNVLELRTDYVEIAGEGGYSLNYDVPLPYTLTGDWATESVNFTRMSDATLRADLADPEKGASLIGGKDPYGSNINLSMLSDPVSGGGRIIAYYNRDVYRRLSETVYISDFIPQDVDTEITDCTIWIRDALTKSYGKTLVFGPYTYRTTEDIVISDSIEITGRGKNTKIQITESGVSGFIFNSVDGAVISNLTIISKNIDETPYTAHIKINNSSSVNVSNVRMDNISTWAGVLIQDSSDCEVINCTFRNNTNKSQDSSDVFIRSNSHRNTIIENNCLGGGDHGIIIQDPYDGSQPAENKIIRNIVNGNKCYGICAYSALLTSVPYNSGTLIYGNRVSGTLGTQLDGKSGSGIFIQGMGGCIIDSNTVFDCAKQTTNFDTQAIACLTIATGQVSSGNQVATICTGNRLISYRGPALWIATSSSGVICRDNILENRSDSSASREESFKITDASEVSFIGNTISHFASRFGVISVTAIDFNISNIKIKDNIINASGGEYFVNFGSPSKTFSSLFIEGNSFIGAVDIGIFLIRALNVIVSDNLVNKPKNFGLVLNNVKNARITGNSVDSNGASLQITGNDNQGTFVDESNNFHGSPIFNSPSSGAHVFRIGTKAPLDGSANSGDRVISSSVAIGSPSMWVCVSSGSPGGWSSTGII